MACLDTTILIDLAGRSAKLRKRALDKLSEIVNRNETLVTTRFNIAELYIGIAHSDDPRAEEAVVRDLIADLVAHSDDPRAEEAVVRDLIADLGILEFNDKAAWLFGQITAHLQNLGRPAGGIWMC